MQMSRAAHTGQWYRGARTALLLQAFAAAAAVFGQTPSRREAPNPEATSGAIQRRVAPPARIVSFTAEPTSIQPGQVATLTWASENPVSSTIDPDVGRVRPRGSRQISPKATTTYTFTIGGPNNTTLTKTVTVTVAGTTPIAATTGTPGKREVPKMADGKPDLTGVYNNTAPNANAGAPAASALPTTPALKPGAEKFKVVRGKDDAGLYADCMPPGVPQAFAVPYQIQFVQNSRYLTILHEYPGIFRIIPLDGGPHQADLDPTWMGDSIGHWEGDTLVVDTIGFNQKTELPGGYKHTDALHVVERFRRADYDVIQYEAVIEDKNVFTGPWRVTRNLGLRTDLVKVDEFVCENNRDYKPLFSK
jgi:hypothetical protein